MQPSNLSSTDRRGTYFQEQYQYSFPGASSNQFYQTSSTGKSFNVRLSPQRKLETKPVFEVPNYRVESPVPLNLSLKKPLKYFTNKLEEQHQQQSQMLSHQSTVKQLQSNWPKKHSTDYIERILRPNTPAHQEQQSQMLLHYSRAEQLESMSYNYSKKRCIDFNERPSTPVHRRQLFQPQEREKMLKKLNMKNVLQTRWQKPQLQQQHQELQQQLPQQPMEISEKEGIWRFGMDID